MLPVVYENLPMPPSHRDMIVNAMVFVHQTLHRANEALVKRGGRVMAITPRHYLDFINHYVSCFLIKLDLLEFTDLVFELLGFYGSYGSRFLLQ